MVKNLSFQFCKLSFIKTDAEELNQLENTVLMKSVFKEYNQALPLKKALSKTQYGFTASAQNSGNCRLLRITDIKEDGINWATVPLCDCNEIEKYKLNEKDILITRTGGTTGKTTLIQEIKETSIFASYLIRLSVSEDYNPEYIYIFLNSYLFWNQILDLKNGTAQPNVNAIKMTTIIFPSCPKEIQDEIVEYKKDKFVGNSVLKKVQFDFKKINIVHQNLKFLISENEKQSDITSKLKQAILQEAIAGQLTAEWRDRNPIQKGDPNTDAAALLAKIKAEKQQAIADGKLKKEKPLPKISPDEIPFSLPDSWVWCRLGEICSKIGSGSTPRGSDYSERGIPFFRSQNIHNNSLVFNDIKYISSEIHRKMNGTAILSGDLLLNITGGSLGRCALVPENINDGNVSQHVCIIRPLLSHSTLFHCLILSPLFQTLVFKQTTGAGREGLPKYNLERFAIPLPPLAEQKAIVEKVDYLMKIIDQLEEQIKHRKQLAEDLMQTVLREAFE